MRVNHQKDLKKLREELELKKDQEVKNLLENHEKSIQKEKVSLEADFSKQKRIIIKELLDNFDREKDFLTAKLESAADSNNHNRNSNNNDAEIQSLRDELIGLREQLDFLNNQRDQNENNLHSSIDNGNNNYGNENNNDNHQNKLKIEIPDEDEDVGCQEEEYYKDDDQENDQDKDIIFDENIRGDIDNSNDRIDQNLGNKYHNRKKDYHQGDNQYNHHKSYGQVEVNETEVDYLENRKNDENNERNSHLQSAVMAGGNEVLKGVMYLKIENIHLNPGNINIQMRSDKMLSNNENLSNHAVYNSDNSVSPKNNNEIIIQSQKKSEYKSESKYSCPRDSDDAYRSDGQGNPELIYQNEQIRNALVSNNPIRTVKPENITSVRPFSQPRNNQLQSSNDQNLPQGVYKPFLQKVNSP